MSIHATAKLVTALLLSSASAAVQMSLPHGAIARAVPPTLPHGAVPRVVPPTMAGFGAPSSGPKRKAKAAKGKASSAKPESGLTAKQSWETFRELRDRSDQVATSSVYARLPDEKWLNVGGVIVESPGTRLEAVAKHKRLILDHAARLHLKLATKPRDIQIGYSDTSVESLSSGDDRIAPLAKCTVPPNLVAGFQGLPDTKSGMYIVGAHNRAVK